ncbi:ribonuclease HIII [Lysinibacillus sphaericus]|uniref:Ribonuclease HIII n=3 Tax=Lysinibacillus TaxID=400634 RepID=RNH3_LYSSC|nr:MULTISPECIES: ribonuclease HIII [Lysinibacillus]B1HW99.1 RecName: Full=Ribonuclease HIII; Short=RNase HIII [Lysinibacillus sphaericus C3-41]MBE5084708.1 ribonuclease HIII [Bacillus thuringiensis]ACA41538.1 Ribonuclease HIII [Lysinibacillus sphaericus C3-41]AMO32592.1 ribonuclease HIII [Lysinibacillus sphaericus]AMR92307.1 ribonuclease HIII [Lysinibacillus sphaericus]ANA46356.1 ribonuclease HIII [Lysinibacillus sphaericus]
MSNIVLSISTNIQKEVMAYYAANYIERKAAGVIFAAKLPDTSITMYKSGKLMFQGGGAEREAARWGTIEKTPNSKSAIIGAKGDTLPDQFALMSVLGSDETGTGDYFGPMTVAAVYVPSSKIELINELGVKDSKMLSDDYMRKIAPDLRAACVHSVLILRNEKYNSLQAKGYSQGKMKAMMHNKALHNTLAKMAPETPEYILIDQFAERGVYYNYLKNEREIVQESVYFSTKAEQLHVAVATASILARAAFLKEMDRLSDIAGLELMKGASNKVDVQAARIWRKQGEEFLRSITKWHFANTEKARKMI